MDRLRREDQAYTEQPGRVMLRLRKGEEKPAGARMLTNDEVLEMQHRIILNWKPRSQMWPFSWGLGILGGSAAVSGIIINNICRQRLGLLSLGRLSTFTPTVALPVVLTSFFHHFLITNRILVGDFPCTVCAAIRSGSLQSMAGGLYPMVLGPMMCVVIARKYHTDYVPALRETAQILPFVRRIMPGAGTLLAILLVNFGVGMAISERETLLFAKYLGPSSSTLEKSDQDEFFY
ncbi:transmembrane protein 126-like [Babylonia areolata]|uniref:transmembrane protein 126-like n=1 Tax=Babylonia areolata TaxID=304850 RepID=UPI003FD5CF0E